jgi:putative ABC transport system ATP-binding protein
VVEHELIVRARGAGKTFSTGGVATRALADVDLDVRSDELLMLVGPSGCGKTTLISVIAGILNHDAGEVAVLGQQLERLSASAKTAFRGRNIGFVFQAYQLIPALTAAENVAIPAILNGVPRKEAQAKAEHLLAQVGLGERRHHRPTQLSGGQQQRVAIARSLIHDPRLIVCDEPTSALDHHSGEQVMELLRAVAVRPGRALIVVTHDSRIYRYADRIAHMEDGRIERISEPSAENPHLETVP